MNFLRSFQSSVRAYIYPVSEPNNNHGESTTAESGLTRERGSSATTVDDLVVLPPVLKDNDNDNRVVQRAKAQETQEEQNENVPPTIVPQATDPTTPQAAAANPTTPLAADPVTPRAARHARLTETADIEAEVLPDDPDGIFDVEASLVNTSEESDSGLEPDSGTESDSTQEEEEEVDYAT